jgi:hypothetical protein
VELPELDEQTKALAATIINDFGSALGADTSVAEFLLKDATPD